VCFIVVLLGIFSASMKSYFYL